MHECDEVLAGGNASGLVVRVQDTVRKPWHRGSAATQQLLQSLREAGVDVPRPLGRDAQGRQVVEFVAGSVAQTLPPLDLDELGRVGGLIRSLHDASPTPEASGGAVWEVLLPPDDPDLICHNDLAPWNLLVGDRWVFIDWDGAGPSTRLWDLAYSAQAFARLDPGTDPVHGARRLRAFVAGYRASPEQRRALPQELVRRTKAMSDLLAESKRTGRQPWARMFDEGHGAYWHQALDYVATHVDHWQRALDDPVEAEQSSSTR